MSDIEFILWCLLQLFLFFLLMKLLSMARLLPLLLYLIGVNTLIPAWAAEHPVAYYGIAALCLLYPIVYWGLKFKKHRQEEREAMWELMARARPLYGPGGYYSQPPAREPENDGREYDGWCER